MKHQDYILKTMENLKGNSPYKVPEGYFDQLSGQIQARIQEEQQSSRSPIIQMMKPWIGLAASFILIATLYFSLGPSRWNGQSEQMVATTNIMDLDPLTDQFNEMDLINYIAEQDLDVTLEKSLSEINLSDFSEEDIQELILF
jgi:hypothetical protein